MRLDILIWVIGIPLLIVTVVLLLYQYHHSGKLQKELTMLEKIKRHSIEYDLVLKAMKLSVWRIDVPTRTITYESDYREATENPILAPDTDVNVFCNTLSPASLDRIHAGIENLVAGRVDEFHEQYEMLMPHRDRSTWGELFATVDKRDMDGNPLTIVGTSMNIDKQKEIEQALIEARNKAEESDRLKSAFLANMSHEIRTPLNAIVGFSEVLGMAQSDEERDQLVALIKQNNAHLLRLFDDMVNMSKLEAGGDTVKKSHFELKELLQELLDRYADMAAQKGLTLRLDAAVDDLRPFTDRERLREILNQYLNNALKFTDKGEVTIGYDVQNDVLRVWVRDTGKGIPADHCDDRLFERFVKVDDFVAGTGLGLSICRTLAMSLGATVGVSSKEGEGSLFWVKMKIE